VPKIVFSGGPPVTHEDILRNIAHAKTLGLPYVQKVPPHDRVLAVVGGGPSINEHVDEIRSFTDVWAINGASQWLRERGIENTFIAVDPHHIVAKWAPGAKKAILCTRIDPSVFEILEDADVRLFSLMQDTEDGGIQCFSSTASLAFDLGTDLGYRKAVFFGCEGSFPGNVSGDNREDFTHAYPEPSEKREERMVVECGGVEYLTAPDFYVQSDEISKMVRMFPQHFSERSGGLLRAMIENDDHDIVKVSRAMMSGLHARKAA
jgi:hypothetical protein